VEYETDLARAKSAYANNLAKMQGNSLGRGIGQCADQQPTAANALDRIAERISYSANQAENLLERFHGPTPEGLSKSAGAGLGINACLARADEDLSRLGIALDRLSSLI
jgi:hypothetical protein